MQEIINAVLGPAQHGGYTILNTIILVAIAFAILYFIFLPIVKKFKIDITPKLAIAGLTYLVAGTLIRSFEDSGLLPFSLNPLEPGFYTHTPGLWFAIGFAMLTIIIVAKKSEPKIKIPYQDSFLAIGTIFLLSTIIVFFLQPVNLNALAGTIIFIAIISAITIIFMNKFLPHLKGNWLNYLAVIGQGIDGGSTFVATTIFSCGEQHFVSRAIIEFFPFLFIVIKLALIVAIIHYIDKEIEDAETRKFAKAVIISLGFMTGTRNIWTLSLGNCG